MNIWMKKVPRHLIALRHGPDKSLWSFISRFSTKLTCIVVNVDPTFTTQALTSSLRQDSPFWDTITKMAPKDVAELMERAQRCINWEELKNGPPEEKKIADKAGYRKP